MQWRRHYMTQGSARDESAAVDCAVEIRNHPHKPPKMTPEPGPPPVSP
jgi:hypothetical protein